MSAKLTTLGAFPVANYVSANNRLWLAHKAAASWSLSFNKTNPAIEIGMLAGAIYGNAVRCGEGGELDYTLSLIVHDMLFSFIELLNYDRGGWDGGTCDSWAHSVGEYIGQPLD
jgi:hypothetical protein